ncbi:IS1 family transposase [Klebsiella sp. MISC125]
MPLKEVFCPVCYGKETIYDGHNPQGTQRIQCRACKGSGYPNSSYIGK